VTQSILTGKDCFVALPEWEELFHSCHGYDETIFDIFSTLATLPSLLKDIRAFRGGEINISKAALVLATHAFRCKVLRHAKDLEASLQNSVTAIQIPSSTGDPLFPTVYRFNDKMTNAKYCLHWACIVIANRLVGVVNPGCGLEEESAEAAKRICMSLEHAATLKPFAAFHMTFALPAAFSACSEEERVWIHTHMNELFEEIHTRYSLENLHVLAVLITGVPISSGTSPSGSEISSAA